MTTAMNNDNCFSGFLGWFCDRKFTEEEIHDIWDDSDNEIIIKKTDSNFMSSPILYSSRVIVNTENHLVVEKKAYYEKISILLTYSRDVDENCQSPVRRLKHGSIFTQNHEYIIDDITFEKSMDSDNVVGIERMICSYSNK
jgi:hypothetical protein